MSVRLEVHVQGGRLVERQIPQPKDRELTGRQSFGKVEVTVSTLPRKASNKVMCARTKTDTGRQEENSKVREKTLVKELGKLHP